LNNHGNLFNVRLNDQTVDWINKQINLKNFKNANEVIENSLSEIIHKAKQPQIIPKEKMDEGINLCRKNALEFLDSAEILIEAGKSKYGIILFQFAKEEIGKLALLRDAVNDSSELISVPEDVFTNHSTKDRKAVDLFGKDAWLIKGGFEEDGFQIFNTFKGFEKPIRTNHEVRLKCTFVNYDKGQKKWILGIDHNAGTLLAKIREVRTKLCNLKI